MPSRLVENEDGMGVGRDHGADLEEMRLHGPVSHQGITIRRPCPPRADGAED